MPRIAVYGAVLVAVVALTVLACEEAQQSRLDDSNRAIRVGLSETSGGENLRVCVESEGGRPVDYYFTSQAAATGWMFAAGLHYAFTNEPYTQPPSVFYRSKIGTTGFTEEFEVTDGQADSANKNFAVIIHATSSCTGTGNSCVVDVAVHSIQVRSWLAIIIGVVILVAIIGGIVACSYFCCCRKPQHPQQQQGVEGAQQIQVQGTVAYGQTAGSPAGVPQQQYAGYQQQPQPGVYPPAPPQQQPSGGYQQQPGDVYAPQQHSGYPAQPHQGPGPGGYPQQQPPQYPHQQSGSYPAPSQDEEMRPLATADEPAAPAAQQEATPGRV